MAITAVLTQNPVHAAANATLSVSNLNDSDAGSLRQVIQDANDGDTINFSTSGTIVLASELIISKSLTINGGEVITVSGNNATRVFNIMTNTHTANVVVALDSLAIISGNVQIRDCKRGNSRYFCGSAIKLHNKDISLTLTNSTISNNTTRDDGTIYNDNGVLTITNSTLANNSAFYGGGIYNYYGTTTVTYSTLAYNSAQFGGGIWNYGQSATLNIENNTLYGNSAAHDGGAIYNVDGAVKVNSNSFYSNSATDGGGIFNFGTTDPTMITISNTVFSGNSANYGGGIYNQSKFSTAQVMINNSRLAGNSAETWGGGLYNDSYKGDSITIIHNSIIDRNSASSGGGIYNDGDFNSAIITISNSTISRNSAGGGGGVYNAGRSGIANMTINNSTLSNNLASSGGGILNYGQTTLIVTNSTLSNNSANTEGGGIVNYGYSSGLANVNISNSTIANNHVGISGGGGGIRSNDNNGTVTTITNTIVAGNIDNVTGTPDDMSLMYDASSDSFVSGGHNLIGTIGTGISAFTNGVNGDKTGVNNPLLHPLADNGGDTLTHLLMSSSPAIFAGDCTNGPIFDQRGQERPLDKTCDIGSVEIFKFYTYLPSMVTTP